MAHKIVVQFFYTFEKSVNDSGVGIFSGYNTGARLKNWFPQQMVKGFDGRRSPLFV